MRLLKKADIDFKTAEYAVDESDLSGVTAAKKLGISPERVFKTLTLRGDKTGIVVALIPVAKEIDLKKLAAASSNKRVEMLHLSEVLGATGYVRGGVSPIGMKKTYPTYIDESAIILEEISISAGQRGVQIIVNPEKLSAFLTADFCDITA